MLGINKGLIWGQFRAPDKESVNTGEVARRFLQCRFHIKGSRPGQ
jgi:hypothetical protein